jgi:hypothetical protein
MKAVRDVILMQSRIDMLTKSLETQSGELKALTQTVIDIDRRVARLEGTIEGVAIAGRARRALPKD